MKREGFIDAIKQQEIARSLGFLTDTELALLAGVQETTLEAWRKRNTGPSYVYFGNQHLYPLDSVREYLAQRVRSGKRKNVAEML
ncbi:helix-turn-helix transcriptional regulator [Stutzerimonas kirkiae]|uniref:helix-turn-helix transcriptional regulator n=1 Tax=Stutzerimonas kirkiae TaxID=2211392 RepID=UPI0010384991|nr:DNA-binding protein [Stutzerimonas kirkiae]